MTLPIRGNKTTFKIHLFKKSKQTEEKPNKPASIRQESRGFTDNSPVFCGLWPCSE